MTASVWKVAARPGDVVDTGQPLVVLEAMKTEMHVTAPVPPGWSSTSWWPRATRSSSGRALVVLGPVA